MFVLFEIYFAIYALVKLLTCLHDINTVQLCNINTFTSAFYYEIPLFHFSPLRAVFNCGGNLSGDSGFVGSEGFPSFYKPNSKCTWYITVSSL